MTRPFKVESADVNRLTDIQLTQLLKELLHAEAFKFDIEQKAVEVALNIRVGDGGEDGRISWVGGVDRTDYIPNRLSMFQNKATKMAAGGYANEIMTAARPGRPSTLKPKVEEVLDQGGSYIVFTTQELNTQEKDERITAVRDKLEEQGKDYARTCDIRIYDASQIAGWVNQFIPTIVSVQHWSGRPVERALKTYELWSEYEELTLLPFADVDSRDDIVSTLTRELPNPKSCFRLMGLSGLGKTRTALQVFVNNEELRNLLVYVDANHAPGIDALIADWVTLGLSAVVVVDNCEYRLHQSLVREVRRDRSKISLLTLDYNIDSVSPPTLAMNLEQMSDAELLRLLSPVYKDQLPDLDRVVSFAQGFPQMAVLLAEARLAEDPRIGELTEDDLASKLLWKRGEEESQDKLKILQTCSLFDVFGIEKEAEYQLEYIASLCGLSVDAVFDCVQEYSKRGVIDRRGRFGQVVPKPLAIRLAGQWWSRSRDKKRKDLIDEIPEGMIEGFCDQVEKMDFHSDVKSLTEELCGPKGPFGQAEVILSIRGSRLFRSFVNVNPVTTSHALYITLNDLRDEDIKAIGGDVRRNLVWGLERLCYHPELFHEAAWCMLLLASNENESWSNNATGMFSQLFRINLSGTGAEPRERFALLKQAIGLAKPEIDLVVLEALGQAISTYGGSRTVGAEYQGTKPPLEEWKPKIWQEIFDYWQESFHLLLSMLERGELQNGKVLEEIGGSIRGFVSRGRIEMLDEAIRVVVQSNGHYWPSALESIKNTFEYEAASLNDEAVAALHAWLRLLTPEDGDIFERIRVVVSNPPWEHRKGEDGHYIDVAAENAKELARELARDIDLVSPYVETLLSGEQKQAYAFGRQLVLELDDVATLLDIALDNIAKVDNLNLNFAVGMYSGIYDKSHGYWEECLEKIVGDTKLVQHYPHFVRTGVIQEKHLYVLLDLIAKGEVPLSAVHSLSYGSVTDNLYPDEIARFCLSLSDFGGEASWLSLDIIYMYCHGNSPVIDVIRDELKLLVTRVPLGKGSNSGVRDVHVWRDAAEKILQVRDEKFVVAIVEQLLSASVKGFEHGAIWSYIKPLLMDIMRGYADIVWPMFAKAISESEGMEQYWLMQLLDRENSFSNRMPSVFSVLPVDAVIEWCKENQELGPQFVASCVNILEEIDDKLAPSGLFVALLENFGHDERVASGLTSNMGTRGWSGSLVPYLENDKAALSVLLEHPSVNVKRWVREHIAYIDKQIEYESTRDDERGLGIY